MIVATYGTLYIDNEDTTRGVPILTETTLVSSPLISVSNYFKSSMFTTVEECTVYGLNVMFYDIFNGS